MEHVRMSYPMIVIEHIDTNNKTTENMKMNSWPMHYIKINRSVTTIEHIDTDNKNMKDIKMNQTIIAVKTEH